MAKEKYIGVKFKTIFNGDFILNKKYLNIINKMIEATKETARMGMKDKNGGNISFKTNEGVIIKRTGAYPGNLKKSDFVLVEKVFGDKVWVRGVYEPSSEARLHWMVYKVRPDIKCVFHAHDFLVINSDKKLKDVIYLKPYSYGTKKSAQAVSNAAKENDYIVQGGHGVVALAKTISGTLKLISKYHEKIKKNF